MSLATRYLAVILFLLTCVGVIAAFSTISASEDKPTGSGPLAFGQAEGLQTSGDTTPAQEELIAFAMGRFGKFDLTLPAVTIIFDETASQCFGYGGIYKPSVREVIICRPSARTMIHELAHAWLESALTANERDRFLETRGLRAWSGGGEWAEQGAEHAAEIVTWALMDVDITVRWIETSSVGTAVESRRLFKIPDSSPEKLFEAFLQLTGRAAVDRAVENPRISVSTTVFSPEAARVHRRR